MFSVQPNHRDYKFDYKTHVLYGEFTQQQGTIILE